MICYACGRKLSNDDRKSNFAHWTIGTVVATGDRQPYCADDDFCKRITLADEVR